MDVNLTASPLLGDVKTKILLYLSDGEKSMGGLSSYLMINKTAVKEHMETLERMGYVRSFFKKEKTGRPSKYYEITKTGMELFPKKYAQLMEAFISEVREEFGEMKLNLILGKVADRLISKSLIQNASDLTEREAKIEKMKSFVDTLNNLGYYARMEIDGEVVRIIRHNCIFYEMAKTSGKVICDVLGKDLIEKSGEKNFSIVEKFSEGGNRCVVEVDLDNQ